MWLVFGRYQVAKWASRIGRLDLGLSGEKGIGMQHHSENFFKFYDDKHVEVNPIQIGELTLL